MDCFWETLHGAVPIHARTYEAKGDQKKKNCSHKKQLPIQNQNGCVCPHIDWSNTRSRKQVKLAYLCFIICEVGSVFSEETCVFSTCSPFSCCSSEWCPPKNNWALWLLFRTKPRTPHLADNCESNSNWLNKEKEISLTICNVATSTHAVITNDFEKSLIALVRT